MPILASANKLKEEFQKFSLEELKNSKDTQYKIMLSSFIKEEEIEKFTDPYHWIRYFP